jgi:hypothetical protein
MKHATRHIALLLAAAVLALVAACAPKPETHQSFASAEEALAAVIAALEKNDDAALTRILGPDAEGLVSSGDAVADRTARAEFLENYRKGHDLVAEGDDRRVLEVGPDRWPHPVPIVKRDGRWYFDGAAGTDELIYRRIGANELGAIAVARGFVEAQEEYAAGAHDTNPPGVYAQKLLSDPGRQNGLYWPTAEDEPASPAGPFVAAASAEGYRSGAEGERVPYHGYFYRPLYAQGDSASGGAFGYFSDGLLTGGFALVAWPADYGVSGVMTFIVNQDGVVFQKDLGEDTATAVEAISVYDPDSSWTAIVPPAEDDTAS